MWVDQNGNQANFPGSPYSTSTTSPFLDDMITGDVAEVRKTNGVLGVYGTKTTGSKIRYVCVGCGDCPVSSSCKITIL